MSALLFAARSGLGVDAKIELLLGTMVGLDPSLRSRLVGFGLHLAVSAAVALAYAWAFETRLQRSGWRAGMLVALVHTGIAGVLIGLMPVVHPLMPETIPSPGFFMWDVGLAGPIVFVLIHLVFGAIVGAMYGPVGRGRGR